MSDNADNAATHELARLIEIIGELREKCPWDREQTIAGVARHLIEEAYEAADAIANGGDREIADELGDVLAQTVFVATMAAEESRFTLEEVARGAREKLIRRHPHIYGDVKAETVDRVLANWDAIKAEEKKKAGKKPGLEDTGRALPALMRAEKLGEKARRSGMDWRDAREVLRKVREELEEAEDALARNDKDAAAAELGDMLLALANAPRFIGHNGEETLRRACDKFAARFGSLLELARSRGLELKDLPPDQVEALWQEIKRGRLR